MNRDQRRAFLRGARAVMKVDPTLTPAAALEVWARGQGLRRAVWACTDPAEREALAQTLGAHRAAAVDGDTEGA
jgi:hypothetical protein